MSISKAELKMRMDRCKAVLKQAGVKLTHQRIEIFRQLARSEEHPDAESVFRMVRRKIPSISLDTVYRTLAMLHDLGLLNTLGRSFDRSRYDANIHSHHHFVCTMCGMTRDFTCAEFDQLKPPQSATAYGNIVHTNVEIRGICNNCLSRKPETPITFNKETDNERKETD